MPGIERPVLLGMNNPLSDDPAFDLYPYPEGSAGWRLWKMLPEGTSRTDYLRSFERRNLLHSREWSVTSARRAAVEVLPSLVGRRVVILGTEVRAALGLPKVAPLSTGVLDWGEASVYWMALPHPSGRNIWYNEPGNRERVGQVLNQLRRGEVGFWERMVW